MENKIITSELAKAIFKSKHDIPLSIIEAALVEKSISAKMSMAMSEAYKMSITSLITPNQYVLSQQAAASDDVDVLELFVSNTEIEERVFSLQIEQDEDDEQYYITWYFVDNSGFISQLISNCPAGTTTPVIDLYYVKNGASPKLVSSVKITGELSPETLYNYHLSPRDALAEGDFILDFGYV